MKKIAWLNGKKRRIAICLLLAAQALPLLDVPDAGGWAGLLTSVAILLGGADIVQTVGKK